MPAHDSFHRYIGELNRLYLKKKAIWTLDHTYDGFKWVDCGSGNKCVFGYTRTDGQRTLLVLLNFSGEPAVVQPEGTWRMLLDTDWTSFGGRTPDDRGGPFGGVLAPFSSQLMERIQQDCIDFGQSVI